MNQHPATRPTVALLYGGRSSEHEISCLTGENVLSAIDQSKFDVLPVRILRDGGWQLDASKVTTAIVASQGDQTPSSGLPVSISTDSERHGTLVSHRDGGERLHSVDVVLPLLHGPFGEDGTVQGLFELLDVAYVGSGVLASSTMMDKSVMKSIFRAAGLPVGPYMTIRNDDWIARRHSTIAAATELGFPLFVKPARGGSSIGISRVEEPRGLEAAVEAARAHDPKVLVEGAIAGRELECGVLEGHGVHSPRASEVGEIEVQSANYYDYDTKYLHENAVKLTCPATLPPGVREKVQELSIQAFREANCEGLARVDWFLQPDGSLTINELNTMPGFTEQSLFPRLWEASRIPFSDLITELITLALERPMGLR